MKILNLYAGIGGNRKLWGDKHDITAVEYDEDIANVYQDFYPNDKVIVTDAHKYLLNFQDYDFIWASPPCPTHSRARFWGWSKKRPVLPDMTLYAIIIFFQNHFYGPWVVENVTPYYEPLIPSSRKIGRHLFWSNFYIPPLKHESSDIRKLSGTSGKDKWKRNAVDPEIGLHILNAAQGVYNAKSNDKQIGLFD